MKTTGIHLNQRGLTLIETLVSIAVVAIFAVGIADISMLIQKGSRQQKGARMAMLARNQIEAALKNPIAWQQTLERNQNFECLKTEEGCSSSSREDGTYDFVIYSAQVNEKLSFDSADGSSRFDLEGKKCRAGVSQSLCPLQFEARWKPLCETEPCREPMLDLTISLTTHFGNDEQPFNTDNFTLHLVRKVNEDAIQSACLVLNGRFNSATRTCFPKFAGTTCAALGKPTQAVVAVHEDGTVECAPIYTGSCDPATEVMKGIDSSGKPICAPKVRPYNCPVACAGHWSPCTAACGGGTQSFIVDRPAAYGGTACPYPAGAVQQCNTQNCPVNCVGSWSSCSASCGGGSMVFQVTRPAAYGGSSCSANHGDTQSCNSQACAVPVSCQGYWNACDTNTGLQHYTVTQWPRDGGAACPASPVACRVDCVGSFGSCVAPGSQTYTWSITPKNGGAACAYQNGAVAACVAPGGFRRNVTYLGGYFQGGGGVGPLYVKVKCVADPSSNGFVRGCFQYLGSNSSMIMYPGYPCLRGEKAEVIAGAPGMGWETPYAGEAMELGPSMGYSQPHDVYDSRNTGWGGGLSTYGCQHFYTDPTTLPDTTGG